MSIGLPFLSGSHFPWLAGTSVEAVNPGPPPPEKPLDQANTHQISA